MLKYIQNAERVFSEIRLAQEPRSISEKKVNNIIKTAKNYCKDAKYYQEKKELETSLTAIAYCEGLLDALRLLGIVEFTWGTQNE